MLCLSRKRDESILIGDDIVITVVDIRGDKVRIGITAPRDVPVDRPEVRDAKLRQTALETAPGSALASPNGLAARLDLSTRKSARRAAGGLPGHSDGGGP